jgi:hypothetical protein
MFSGSFKQLWVQGTLPKDPKISFVGVDALREFSGNMHWNLEFISDPAEVTADDVVPQLCVLKRDGEAMVILTSVKISFQETDNQIKPKKKPKESSVVPKRGREVGREEDELPVVVPAIGELIVHRKFKLEALYHVINAHGYVQ